MCWYCTWGWPRRVAFIYAEACRWLGDAHPMLFGPGHVVWSDANFHCAESSIEHFDEYAEDLSAQEAAIVMWSLEALAKIPMDERDPAPDDIDWNAPEDYPPPAGLKLVKPDTRYSW